MKKKTIVIPVRKFADLSTCHITREDGAVLENRGKELPYWAGRDQYGYWLWVPGPKAWEENETGQELVRNGFSADFVELFATLSRMGIPYVRFDQDGEVVENLKRFDW